MDGSSLLQNADLRVFTDFSPSLRPFALADIDRTRQVVTWPDHPAAKLRSPA